MNTAMIVVFAVFVESVQWLIIASIISHHIPLDTSYYMARVFEKQRTAFGMTRQVLLYRIFILMNIGLTAMAAVFARRLMQDQAFMGRVWQYACVQLAFLCAEGFAIFKIVTIASAPWAWGILYVSVALALCTRIFWPEMVKVIDVFLEYKSSGRMFTLGRWMDVGIVSMIAIVLMMSWPKDQSGLMGSIVYFGLFYLFLRVVLQGRVGAVLGLFLWIKWSLLYAGVIPSIWPSSVGISKFTLDAAVFLLLALHLNKRHSLFFTAACILVGLGVALGAWMGLMMLLVLTIYAVGNYHWDKFNIKCSALGAWLIAFPSLKAQFLFFIAQRPEAPLYMPLSDRHFLIFIFGVLLPVIYAMTIAIIGSLLYTKQINWRHWLIVAIAIYGLGSALEYIANPQVPNYYRTAMPLACIISFGVQQMLNLRMYFKRT